MVAEKILIVEDERIVARDIAKRLTKLGYVVSGSVATGEEAVQKVAELQPDLVLMDIQLRGAMDGVEAAEHIRANSDVSVIFLTAYADENTLQRVKATEPFGYVIKPFDEKDLHTAVEVALRRRLAEAAIRVALEKEKELTDLKSRFWAMMAHEFRSPMTSILSSAQFLERYYRQLPEERIHEYFQLIQDNVRLMDRLLNDVFTISRAEGGYLKFEPELINLEEFCQRLLDEMRFSMGSSHSIVFHYDCPCESTCADENLLRHVLSNLISNAVKYSPPGSTVYLELSCPDDQAIFKVIDSGIGIPTEAQQHLFEPFHRAGNVSGIPGTGLGLTLVKKCLDLHGGQILVDSQVGVGTTVTVTLFLNRYCVQTQD